MVRTRFVALAAAVLGVALLSACGSYNSPGAAQPTGAGSATGASGQAAGTSLIAKAVGNLGMVVTDGSGRTLYRFDLDSAKPPTSKCTDECATKWPPAVVTGQIRVKGVDKALVGTITRADGTRQLTLGGQPLYRFAKDTAAGQVNGQGVGGSWYAANPQGRKATATKPSPTPPSPTEDTSGGGYSY